MRRGKPLAMVSKPETTALREQRALNLPLLAGVTVLLSAAIGASYVFIDLSLNRMGASATSIGMNAAMPALGWLLTTPFLPWLVRRANTRGVLLALLVTAALAAVGFAAITDQRAWLALRFLLGSGLGVAFRLIEYWISAASPAARRGRNAGIYAAVFCTGAAGGAGILPLAGAEGWPAVSLIVGLICGAMLLLACQRSGPPAILAAPQRAVPRLGGPAMVAIVTAGIIGLLEAVPYTMMPVYAVRMGIAEDWAAWTTSAFLAGQMLLVVPMGMLADRLGKLGLLAVGALAGLLVALGLPALDNRAEALLFAMLAWGGSAGCLYALALAMLADHFAGAELAAINAVFGTVYAAGALFGPLLHGMAMDWHGPRGLIESSALLFLILLAAIAWRGLGARRLDGWAT